MKIQEFLEGQVTERIQEQIVFQGTVETTCIVPQDRVQSQIQEQNFDVHTIVFQETVEATREEQVHSLIHEHNIDVNTSVFQDIAQATSLIPQERVQSHNHVHNFAVHTSALERLEEKVGGIDVSLLKI